MAWGYESSRVRPRGRRDGPLSAHSRNEEAGVLAKFVGGMPVAARWTALRAWPSSIDRRIDRITPTRSRDRRGCVRLR